METPKPYKPFSYLQDHELTPPASVWEAVDANLEKNRRKKRIFFLWRNSVFALLVLSSLVTSYIFYSSTTKEKINPKDIASSTPRIKNASPVVSGFKEPLSESSDKTNLKTATTASGNKENAVQPEKLTKSIDLTEPESETAPDSFHFSTENAAIPEVREGIIKTASSTPYRSAYMALNKLKSNGVQLLAGQPGSSALLADYHSAIKGKANRSKRFIEVYYLPMVKFSRFEAPDAAPVYVQIRDSSENPEFGYAAGLRAGYRFNERIFITAGLQFSKQYDKFKGDYKTRTVVDRYDTTYLSLRPRGVSGKPTLYGVNYLHKSDTLIQVSPVIQNVVERSLSVPISAGLRFDKEEVVFTLQFGAVFNLYRSYSGRVIDPTFVEHDDVVEHSKYPFSLKQSTDLWFSPGIEWRVGGQHALITEPRYHYRLGNVYGTDYPVRLNWQSIGMLIGWRVWL